MSRTPPRASSRSRPASPKSPFGGAANLADRFANVSLASTDGGGAGAAKGAYAAPDTSNVFFSRSKYTASPVKSTAATSTKADGGTLSISQSLGAGMNPRHLDQTGGERESDSADLFKKKDSTGASKQSDRFIPQRTSKSSTVPPPLSSHNTSSASDLSSSSAFLQPDADLLDPTAPANTRILAFSQAPPSASTSHDLSHAQLRRYTKAPTSASAAAPGAAGAKLDPKLRKRAIPTRPERVLDAPGMVDDYYLNLLAWSSDNMVGIGLGEGVYIWNAESGGVIQMGEPDEESPQVTSLTWAGDGAYLAVGNDRGEVEVWDAETGTKLRTMAGHAARVPVLSWHGHLLSSGCTDGSIHHHDVRVARHKVGELLGHTAEVCGLTWRSDGQILASGGNDNVVNCWDARTAGTVSANDSESGEPLTRSMARWTKRHHTAAVKALAWCPWQTSLLATGGGTGDQNIHFWSSTTGSRISSLPTSSQVTSLIFSPHSKEIFSTHGFPNNNICLWSYPSLQQIWEVPAHDTRVLASALSPDGSTVGTAASDENLKFWKIWDARPVGKGKGGAPDEDHEMVGGATSKSGKTGGIKIR